MESRASGATLVKNPNSPLPISPMYNVKAPSMPRPILGGYGAYVTDQERAAAGLALFGADSQADMGAGKGGIGAENLSPWRMLGWFVSIWLPFTLALPWLAANLDPKLVSSSSVYGILLALSVTISSPILALHVIFSSPPVPSLPSAFFGTSGVRSELMESFETETVSSGNGTGLPVDMAQRNASKLTVHDGRRSGDIWIEKGHASDDGRSKISRVSSFGHHSFQSSDTHFISSIQALSMGAPLPKLACMDPRVPSPFPGEDERTLTNPTPEPGAYPIKSTATGHNGYTYTADPVIEAATRILANQAADKARAERARLSSRVSAFTTRTGTTADDEELHDSLAEVQQAHAKVMVAQRRHFSSLAMANTITIPPVSSRLSSAPPTPTGESEFVTVGPSHGAHVVLSPVPSSRQSPKSLQHSRSRSEMVQREVSTPEIVIRASGISIASRSSAGSSQHIRSRSASSAFLGLAPPMTSTPRSANFNFNSASLDVKRFSAASSHYNAPLTPPPAMPLPPTPPSVRAMRSASPHSHVSVGAKSIGGSVAGSVIDIRASQALNGQGQGHLHRIQLGDAVIRHVRSRSEDDVTWAGQFDNEEGYSTSGSSFKFAGFNALDEEEVEALIVGGGPMIVNAPPISGPGRYSSAATAGSSTVAPLSLKNRSGPSMMTSTPKRSKISSSSSHMHRRVASIPESQISFSSPDVHSTPKSRRGHKNRWNNMSLPS